jgi:hypothetical protein
MRGLTRLPVSSRLPFVIWAASSSATPLLFFHPHLHLFFPHYRQFVIATSISSCFPFLDVYGAANLVFI